MSGLAELQNLFDELKPMLASIGINTDPPNRSKVRKSIAGVEQHLANHQLELHPHVKWFWENWPPLASEIVHPGFTGPDFAVEVMKDRAESPFLVPIGYGSHRDLLADMIPSDGGPGIYVLDYFDDHGTQLVFAGFADLLRYIITFFDDMRDDPYIGPDVESPFEFVASRDRLVALLPPDVPDDEKRPIGGIDTWPLRWRTNRNLGEDVAALRGATHTVAELISARQHGPVEATLLGQLTTIGGSANGSHSRLSDGTGSVELRILPGAPRFGESPTGTYEVDVIADQQTEPERSVDEFDGDRLDISRMAQSGLSSEAMDMARDMTMRGLGEHITGHAPIRGTAVRPVR